VLVLLLGLRSASGLARPPGQVLAGVPVSTKNVQFRPRRGSAPPMRIVTERLELADNGPGSDPSVLERFCSAAGKDFQQKWHAL